MSRVNLQDRLRGYVSSSPSFAPSSAPTPSGLFTTTRDPSPKLKDLPLQAQGLGATALDVAFDISRKQLLPWSLRDKIDRIHVQLAKLLTRKNRENNLSYLIKEKFAPLDKNYSPSKVSLVGFTQLLKKTILDTQLTDDDYDALYRYYDFSNGKGSLDVYDFLIGLRYTLKVEVNEKESILQKLQRDFKRRSIVPCAANIKAALDIDHIMVNPSDKATPTATTRNRIAIY